MSAFWVGWFRLRESAPWRRACTGATLSECSRKLNEATRGLKLKNSDYCLTSGAVPNVPPRKGERSCESK